MRIHKSRVGIVTSAVFASVFSGSVFALPASAAQADQVTIDLAAISDFHGHIENASLLQAQLTEIKAKNPNFLFVANGDSVGGSAYVSSIADDQPTIEILGKMGLSVSGGGNHEFDQGKDDFLNRIVPAAKTAGFDFTLTGIDGLNLPPYIIKEVAGVKIAFVSGVTDELSTLVSPAGIVGLKINDPIEAINQVAAQLKDGEDANGEADIVVALSHATISKASALSADVDAGVAGHTHHQESLVTDAGAKVLEVGSYGEAFGHYTFTYDSAEKKLVSVEAKNVVLPTVERGEDGTLPAGAVYDQGIEALYLAANEKAQELGSGKVGEITGEANRATNDGSDFGANRGAESPLGNLIAEAFYGYSQGMENKADFAIMNPGGLRADLDPNKDGIVTIGESYSVQPFGNAFATASYTGAQIYTMLEQQWNAAPDADRPILRLGLSKNLKYVYDPNAPHGRHVLAVFLNDQLIDLNRTYTIASNNFLLAGGDGFTVLGESKTYKDTGLIDNDVFNEYLKAAGGAVKPDSTQRSFGVSGVSDLKAGQSAELRLSSLAMTGNEIKPSKVSVSLGRNTVTAEIDTAVSANLDETGTAGVLLNVPEDLSGTTVLHISTDDGSSVALPVNVRGVQPAADAGQEQGQGTPDMHGSDSDSMQVKLGELADTGSQTGLLPILAVLFVLFGAGVTVVRKKFSDSRV